MKLKLSAAMVTLALLSACGGGGDTGLVGENTTPIENVPESDRDGGTSTPVITSILDEDRTRPTSGFIASDSYELKSNGAAPYSDIGDPPQRVYSDRVAAWPYLYYGNFMVSNNPWNASAAVSPMWYQEISLYDTGAGYGVKFDWDWGAIGGNQYNTKSYPEVIYGTKSANERSGTYQETGLPVEISQAPVFTIDYDYSYEARESTAAPGTPSEFNVAIESFYHDTCDVKRTGSADDNTVFETMVWLRIGQNKPSGDAPRGTVATSDGRIWDIYTKVNSNKNYIAFVAQQEEQTGTVMYSELLDHGQDFAVEYGIYPLQDSHCLANILMGTEIWYGAGSFNLNQFTVNRTY